MKDWFQRTLLSLSEAVLWGRAVFITSWVLGTGISWEGAAAVVFVGHLAGQLGLSKIREISAPTDADKPGSGPDELLKRRILLVWTGIVGAMGASLWIILKNSGRLSWLPTGLTLTVLASAGGINAVTKRMDSSDAQKRLVFGSVAFFLMALTKVAPQPVVLRDTILYLCVSTVFLIRQKGKEVDRSRGDSQNRWNAGSVISVAAILILALILTFGSSVGKQLLSDIMSLIYPLAEKLLEIILLPVGYLIQWLITVLKRFIVPDESRFKMEFESFRDDIDKLQQEEQSFLALPLWAKIMLWGLFITAVVVILWRIISRMQQQSEEDAVEESRTSLASSGAVREWLNLMLNGGKKALGKSLNHLRHLLAGSDPQNVEQLYSRTVELMGKKGFPRHLSLTPFEYLQMVQAFADEGPWFDYLVIITDTFSACHYSGRNPGKTEWELAISSYRSLSANQEWPAPPAMGD